MLGSRKTRRAIFTFATAAALAGSGTAVGPAIADGVAGANIVSGEDGAEIVPDKVCTFSPADNPPEGCTSELEAGRWGAEFTAASGLDGDWRMEVHSNKTGLVWTVECSSADGASGCRMSGSGTQSDDDVEKVRLSGGMGTSNSRVVFRLVEGGFVRAFASPETAAAVFEVSRLPESPDDHGLIEI